MRKLDPLLLFFNLAALSSFAQETLPHITVKDIGGKIIVSWQNEYPFAVKTINIQRSFDSLNNYSTIGSVLNPQNRENGYADDKPPYNKMYYRLFIVIDGNQYIFSEPVRPVKEPPLPLPLVTAASNKPGIEYLEHPVVPVGVAECGSEIKEATDKAASNTAADKNKLPSKTAIATVITYPSRRIFTGKDNNVSIYLPDAATVKYSVKFFDENNKQLFELNKIHDDFLIIEKVNFLHSGWFHFEIFESGKLIESNRFFIPKDGKNTNAPGNEQGKQNK